MAATAEAAATTTKNRSEEQQNKTRQDKKQNNLYFVITCGSFADLSSTLRLHTFFAVSVAHIVTYVILGPQFQGKVVFTFDAGSTAQTLSAVARAKCCAIYMKLKQNNTFFSYLINHAGHFKLGIQKGYCGVGRAM